MSDQGYDESGMEVIYVVVIEEDHTVVRMSHR